MKHLIDILDLSVEDIDRLICTANDIIAHPETYREACRYQKLATLFFEPSTRTRLSFEAAMMELGGGVLGFSEASSSSITKGETLADTVTVIGNYADIIVMRHPKEGAPLAASLNSRVPIINAGDGGHHHPTQTLADLLTISRDKGRLHNLTIGLCGDLKFGRTVHSLITAMARYPDVKFVLISPEELQLPDYVLDNHIRAQGIAFEQTTSLEDALPMLDVLYMTRVQRERFADEAAYFRLRDRYILTPEKLQTTGKDMIVLHPLPRMNEIATTVDRDPRARYFEQAKNGKYIRMALILQLLSAVNDAPATISSDIFTDGYICRNPHCISRTERDILPQFRIADTQNGICRCVYCDAKARPVDKPTATVLPRRNKIH